MIKSLKDNLYIKCINKMTDNKISNYINKMDKMEKNIIIDEWIKFKLIKKSKFPTDEWQKKNKYKWNKTKHHKGNWGCPTGKINNIIGFDPDHYKWDKWEKDNKKEHPFNIFLKGRSWDEYIKEINTLTIETANGGHHFYFNYNKLPQINSNIEIDIKSCGGYLVGPGSKVLKKDGETVGEYKVINDSDIKDMPEDLYNWLYNNLNYKHNLTTNKTTYENKKNTKIQKINPDIMGYYNYDFTDNEIIKILDNLPISYIINHDDWLKTATAIKSINKVDLFLDFLIKHKKTKCQQKGDQYYNKNVNLINGINKHNDLDMINHLLKKTNIPNARTMLDYVKYKPILKGTYKIESTKINAEKLGYKIEIEENKNYVIKSDTGTGKTTIAKEYVKKHKKQLISIVSRISLGDAQYEAFNEFGLDVLNYRLVDKIHDGLNVIVTIDSIARLNLLTFKNYVLFLDEYNSLIEYLITCPNLKNKRVVCFKYLLRLMTECDQIICADADIHPATLKMLDYCNRDYKFIENDYKHNNGCKSSEIFNYPVFMKQLEQEPEALVCCDSKGESEVIFNDKIKYELLHNGTIYEETKSEGETEGVNNITNKWQKYIVLIKNNITGKIRKYALITSDTDEMLDLDDFDFVVFSPKIIYGLDSQNKRPVYCHYKEHTISPRAMLQQVCRCRNITYLKYIFYKKEFVLEKYTTLKEVEDETRFLEELAIFDLMCTKEENILYNEMFNIITYNTDAYNTNKFGHYKAGLRDKGFRDITDYYQTNNATINEKAKENKQDKYDNFSCDNPIYESINEYLNLPKYKWKNYKELFIDQADLQKHFNIQTYFFKGEKDWTEDLKGMEEFKSQKMTTNKNKFIFLKKLLTDLKIKTKDHFIVQKGLTPENSIKTYNFYKLMFRDRTKINMDLTIPTECEKFMARIYKNMFGKSIVQAERVSIAGKKINVYEFNWDDIYYHRDISQYKYKSIKRGKKLNLSFDQEETLTDTTQPIVIKNKLLEELKSENKKNNNNGLVYFKHYKNGYFLD